VVLTFFVGCSSPNTANIDLRKQIDDLHSQIDELNRHHNADQATIAGMKGATTVPSFSEDRLAQLFTTHDLKFGRLTGADAEGVKVFVCPTDDDGQALKAAGAFEIGAFDLAASGETRVGQWTFDVEQARQNWYGQAMLYTYVLKCPWQHPPEHSDITIRVTFTDALTGRKFTVQRVVKFNKSSNAQ
jgi:hypothetical protein